MGIESILRKKGKKWMREEIEEVFNWLYNEKEIDRLVHRAYMYTHDFELAEDVVQKKLKDAFHHIQTYNPERYKGLNNPFLNWLNSIVSKAAIKEAKSESKRRAIIQPFDIAELEKRAKKQHYPPGTMPLVFDQDWEEQWELILSYVDSLSPKLSEAIRLHYIHGLSTIEAAGQAGCSPTTMRARLYYARIKLRQLVPKQI
jgi:RNA polymerase sigma factor (sigma-70 family)